MSDQRGDHVLQFFVVEFQLLDLLASGLYLLSQVLQFYLDLEFLIYIRLGESF
jgi:hypothetical protein